MREEDVAEGMQLVQRLGEGVFVADDGADLVLEDLRVEQLLAVFPLIQCLGLVEPLIALHADQRQIEPGGNRFGQLGLADAGWAFDQDGLLQIVGDIDRGGDLLACNIADIAQAGDHLIDRCHGGAGLSGRMRVCHGLLLPQECTMPIAPAGPLVKPKQPSNGGGLAGVCCLRSELPAAAADFIARLWGVWWCPGNAEPHSHAGALQNATSHA